MATASPSKVAGVKRAAAAAALDMPLPSLLPAFEPLLSSSPSLPRPAKRVLRESPPLSSSLPSSPVRMGVAMKMGIGMRVAGHNRYPTPLPTSSTGIESSSPPAGLRAAALSSTHAGFANIAAVGAAAAAGGGPASATGPRPRSRPGLQRTISSLSERAPLVSVPSIELDAAGEETLLGRSGRSSTYQLSTNKLISRVHVRAAYVPASHTGPAKVELVCEGWNGVKVHCQGKAWELGKGDTFTSESQDADIMIDVHDARVLLQWPKATCKANTPVSTTATDSGVEDENSPSRAAAAARHNNHNNNGGVARRGVGPSSPLRPSARLVSPISPTPAAAAARSATAGAANTVATGNIFGARTLSTSAAAAAAAEPAPIQIYEDEEPHDTNATATQQPTQSTQRLSQPLGASGRNLLSLEDAGHGYCSDENDEDDDGANEENDPLVHSFHAAGDNLLSRLAGVSTAGSPLQRTQSHSQLQPLPQSHSYLSASPKPVPKARIDTSSPLYAPLTNHIINQLAFARIASTPLSIILGNLPASLTSEDLLKTGTPLSRRTLLGVIESIECVGAVNREGKDAAGIPLESEFYYILEKDPDASRRLAVEGLRKPGLRNCRKSHKVCCVSIGREAWC